MKEYIVATTTGTMRIGAESREQAVAIAVKDGHRISNERFTLLLEVADYLEEKVKPDEFSMELWGELVNKDGRRVLREDKDRTPECRTVCCILGHAAMMPKMQALGLVPSWSEFGNLEVSYMTVVGYRWGHSYAGAHFFQISLDEAKYIFIDPHNDKNLEYAISKLRNFVSDKLAGKDPLNRKVMS